MMNTWIFSHQLKKWYRSPVWPKSLVTNILFGFLVLVLLLYILLLGVFIDVIIEKVVPGKPPIEVFNGILLYYLLVDLMMRFFLQSVPSLEIENYLHLPIKRSRIIHFLSLQTLFSVFNILPFLVLIPFAIKVIALSKGITMMIMWLIMILGTVLSSNFLTTYFKRVFYNKPLAGFAYGGVLALLMVANFYNIVNVNAFSASLFSAISSSPVLMLIPFLVAAGAYYANYVYMQNKLYPESFVSKKKQKTDRLQNIKYLGSLGHIGDLMLLEIKLLWRNKRPKSSLPFLPFALLYGLIFYPQDIYIEGFGFLIFVGVFMTGLLMLQYGMYILSWESNYFDKLLTEQIDYRKYFKTKYILMIVFTSVVYILTIPYIFFGIKVLLINTATFLFNIGVTASILLVVSSNNQKRFDLTKNASFNYQGIGASQWILSLMVFLLPILLFLPFWFFGIPWAGIAFLALLGVIGIISHQFVLGMVVKRFMSRKYKIADGFRAT